MSTAAFDLLHAELRARLDGNTFGEPFTVTPLVDRQARVRLTVGVWARPTITRTRVVGYVPQGEAVASDLHARAALAPEADKAAAAWAFGEELRRGVAEDPWRVLGALQGSEPGPKLDAKRCVMHRCGSCAGAGGFVCPRCDGAGRTRCHRCNGVGEVDAVCEVCAGGQRRGSLIMPLWDEAMQRFRLAPAEGGVEEVAAGCSACGGAGAKRGRCEACAGVGEETCSLCEGRGRVLCETCEGHGGLTDHYVAATEIERNVHVALIAPADQSALEAATRRAYDALAADRAFEPRLMDFASSDLGHRIVFETELAIAGARVAIGARSPRLAFDVYGFGTPMRLIDPPRILDAALDRRLDGVATNGARAFDDSRKAIADALGECAMGRRALAAAARRDARCRLDDFAPLLSRAAAERIFALAKQCHLAVGWRARAWIWPAAALAAPLMALLMLGLGYDGVIRSPIGEAQAQTADDAGRGAAGAVGALLPFFAYWAGVLSVAAWIFSRSASRLLGVTRRWTAGDVLASGLGPWTALAVGGGLYAAVFFSGVSAGGPAVAAVDQSAPELATPAAPLDDDAPLLLEDLTPAAIDDPAPRDLAGDVDPGDARVEAPAASEDLSPTALAAFDWRADTISRRWRAVDGSAAIAALSGDAALQTVCVDGTAHLALHLDDAPDAATVVFMVDGVAPVRNAADRLGGALIWRATFSDTMRLRRGNSVQIAVSGPGVEQVFRFRLSGSDAAVRASLSDCPPPR